MKNSWVSRSLLLHFVASLIIEFGQIMETFKLNVNLNYCIWHKDWYLRDHWISVRCLYTSIDCWLGKWNREEAGHDYRNQKCILSRWLFRHNTSHDNHRDLSRCSAWQIRVTCHESVTNVRSRARQLNYHNIHQWGSDCKITFVVVRLRLRFQCTLTLYVTIYDERLDLGSDKSHFSDRRATGWTSGWLWLNIQFLLILFIGRGTHNFIFNIH